MTAIRLARGYTGRSKIIKFEGCYHGHADSLLVKAGSGMLTFGNPTSAGVPPEFIQHTLVLDYNRLESVKAAFEKYGPDIACIIRSEERRVGKECVSTWRSRWSP